jgi:class 3 adenylate cyclase/tetratricopeptide (TPR) repeat protein
MASAASDGQRRQVTVLFADMADYTPMAERIGEEAVFTLMQDVIGRMSEAVHAHGGAVQNVTGDGLMALFGAPVAVEDAPLKACRAALDIQDRMRTLAGAAEARHGVVPQFRVGLHTGPLVVGQVGDDQRTEVTALGDTVNLAARLQGEAEPGGIVMSEATQRLVTGYAESTFLGERAIKGKSEPQRVHSLVGLKSEVSRFDVSVSRGLTTLVGRQAELETLTRCWEEARAGALRIVDIVGEAGIGKSRLVHDFRLLLDADKVFILQGRCTAEGATTPFLPFIEIVRASFRMLAQSKRADVERRLRRGLETLGIDVAGSLPYLLNLLGHEAAGGVVNALDSETVGVRTRDALLALLRERRRISPVIMFIDDLHWMDHASEELLARIAEADRDLPLLLIRAYRPQYAAPRAPIDEATTLRLNHLSRDSTVALLRARLGVEEIPDALARLVAEKAEGNPLFAEEIASYLVEKGSITLSAGTASYEAVDGTALPVTLENLLMDRYDRLEAGPRAVLETASVIGPVFLQDLVVAASGLNGEVPHHLEDLEGQDLVVRDSETGGWRFKHVLVREAIYDSLLGPQRQALHARVAEAIEGAARRDGGESVDLLAHHYAQAGNDAMAVHYLALAGERSLIVYSLEEAETRFRDAIQRIEANPDCADDAALVEILLKLARVLYFNISFYDIIAMVERYLPVVERLGDRKRLARFLFETGYAQVFSAQHEAGKPMLERALAIGEEIGDDEAIGYASMGLVWHYASWETPTRENVLRLRELAERGLRIALDLKDVWLASKILAAETVHYNIAGRPDQARRKALRLMEYGRTTNDPRPRAMGLWGLAFLGAIYFDYEDALASAEESIAIGLNPVDHALALTAKAIALTGLGRAAEALECFHRARARLWEGGLVLPLNASDPHQGVAMLMEGDIAGGVHWIKEAGKRFEALGNVAAAASTDLFLGEIFLEMATGKRKPPPSVLRRNLWFLLRTLPFALRKARRHLETAAQFYRDYDMPALLAWALMDLGRLHAARKRGADARACLEEALPLARSVEEPALIERIDRVLAALPA